MSSKTKSLLEMAKSVQVQRRIRGGRIDMDQIELAIAFVKSEITPKQMLTVLKEIGETPRNYQGWAFSRIMNAIRGNKLDLIIKE